MLVLTGPAEFPLGCTSRANPALEVFRVFSNIAGQAGSCRGAASGVKGFKREQCKKMLLSNQSVRTWGIMRLESDTWHGFVKGK